MSELDFETRKRREYSKRSLTLSRITTVFVDYDDTLHDSESKLIQRFDGLLSLSGERIKNTYDAIHDIIHRNFPDEHSDLKFHARLLFQHLGIPYDEKIADNLVEKIRTAFQECHTDPIFFGDSFYFLNGIKESGFKVYLTTVDYGQEKIESLEKYGARKFFTSAYDEEIVCQKKSDPEFFREALNRSSSSPSETVCIGNSLLDDIIPSKSLGIKTIWLRRNGNLHKNQDEADFEVNNLREALNLLRKLNGVHSHLTSRQPSSVMRRVTLENMFFKKGGV